MFVFSLWNYKVVWRFSRHHLVKWKEVSTSLFWICFWRIGQSFCWYAIGHSLVPSPNPKVALHRRTLELRWAAIGCIFFTPSANFPSRRQLRLHCGWHGWRWRRGGDGRIACCTSSPPTKKQSRVQLLRANRFPSSFSADIGDSFIECFCEAYI